MKILFFSPHAYFSVHALPEAIVAETLLHNGNDIFMVTCDGFYRKHCLCMSNLKYNDHLKKTVICKLCKSNRDAISDEFNFYTLSIDKYLSQADSARVENAINALDRVGFLQFEWKGIPVARYALYEFWLNHKLSSEDLSPRLWPEYLSIFENTLKTLLATQNIINEINPDRIVSYNSLYSVNRVVAAAAEISSIPHFSLHAGPHHTRRRQQMTISKGIAYEVNLNRLPRVEDYRNTPCNNAQIDIVTEHVCELFEATSMWVYTVKSSNRSSHELIDRFGVKAGQKVLLAVMRSADERNAARYAGVSDLDGDPLFIDQFEWLSWLIEFAKARPEYVIIFRVHPREFPNKREAVTSQNAYALIGFIGNIKLPENLYINFPSDNLSIHDLLKITDVVLNNTSTVGLEASLFGVPVVGIRDKLCAFDPALQEEPDSLEDYVSKIADACRSGWRFSRVIGAYRWLNYLFSENAIDISDGYKPGSRPVTGTEQVIQYIRRRLLRAVKLGTGFNETRGRARPLANKEKLIYTIVNNEDSHIGIFPMEQEGNPHEELERIKRAYTLVMGSISDPDDGLFRLRVDSCLMSALSSEDTAA